VETTRELLPVAMVGRKLTVLELAERNTSFPLVFHNPFPTLTEFVVATLVKVPVVPFTVPVVTLVGVKAPVETAPLKVPVVPLTAPVVTLVGVKAPVDTAPLKVPVVPLTAPVVILPDETTPVTVALAAFKLPVVNVAVLIAPALLIPPEVRVVVVTAPVTRVDDAVLLLLFFKLKVGVDVLDFRSKVVLLTRY
jgi:hypothetical protein